jgi:hypothetical protein
MPAKTKKTELETITEVFGVLPDPEDIDYLNFMYSRGDISPPSQEGADASPATSSSCRTLRWSSGKRSTRFNQRDGERFWREAGSYLHKAVSAKMQNPLTRRRAELRVAA